jgi:hypothetical protein
MLLLDLELTTLFEKLTIENLEGAAYLHVY